MATISYDKECKKNSDCKSNVCEMIYEDGEPKGRYCLENTEEKYTKKCRFNKDCKSGKCAKIFNTEGHLIAKRCERAKPIDKDTSYNSLFNSKSSGNKQYGAVQSSAIDQKIEMELGEEGPLSKIILLIFNIIADTFCLAIYNYRISGDPDGDEYEDQGILYKIFFIVFEVITKSFLEKINSGLIWGAIQARHEDKSTGKCAAGAKGLDMWYFRTFVTILFPPFGVFMARGILGFPLMLGTGLLTMMGYFPGLIYAFAVINQSPIDFEEITHLNKLN